MVDVLACAVFTPIALLVLTLLIYAVAKVAVEIILWLENSSDSVH